MAKLYSTPGVYIEEKNAFTNSVVPVATAIPVFIGFTEFATRNHQSLTNTLVKISSFDEFNRYFGGPPKLLYTATVDLTAATPIEITPPETQYYLYYSLKLYFNNGGGDCYIYSAGPYKTGDVNSIMSADIVKAALALLLKEPEPTIIVIPDGHTMPDAATYYELFQLALPHCREMINRFSILDIHGGGDPSKLAEPADIDGLLKGFYDGIGSNDLNYGATYWPWVQASVVQPSDLDYFNLANLPEVVEKINTEAASNYPEKDGKKDPRLVQIEELTAALSKETETATALLTKDGAPAPTPEAIAKETIAVIKRQHNALMQISSIYKAVMKRVRETANILPPCGAMAGAYKATDASVGTHQAPANLSLISVSKPMVNIDDHQQENLNIPINGKAINAIRTFPGKGVLVWGARTMDGNSQDWRYISVRRTVSMIELSIKYAAEVFVFQPNNSSTWSNLKAMITNFLTNMWYAGALAGATPESSFSVDVGIGSTMTPVDVLDGYMRISVKIAVTRPAEFIVITFEQQMQTS